MSSAMHGDLVLVRLEHFGRGRSPEGSIIRILRRAHTSIVGKLERYHGYGYVIPADHRITQDIYIPLRSMGDAESDQMVVTRIVNYPTRKRNPEGVIVEVLGTDREPGVSEDVIARQYELPYRFSRKTRQEVSKISDEIPARALKGRLDLRDKLTVTIDGENARDFDDAISIELSPKSTYLLWVHVADVSHYAPPGSSLDRDAFERGTSVYFPGRVIPMLPGELSNGICSLNPEQDRLAITVFAEFSRQERYCATTSSRPPSGASARLTYGQVAKALEENSADNLPGIFGLLPALGLMRELAGKLQAVRRKRGSIDFDLPEAEILLDLRGDIKEICRADRNVAHRIIEEFMIAANETVAAYFHWLKVPGLYRVHEKPEEETLASFSEFSSGFGHRFPSPHSIQPKVLSDFLSSLQGLPEERVLNQVLLRSMKQARYNMENIGHFGLASPTYTHFTSPIRRYPRPRRPPAPPGAPSPREVLAEAGGGAHPDPSRDRRPLVGAGESRDGRGAGGGEPEEGRVHGGQDRGGLRRLHHRHGPLRLLRGAQGLSNRRSGPCEHPRGRLLLVLRGKTFHCRGAHEEDFPPRRPGAGSGWKR